jgi:hypothetical protein
MTIDTKNLKVGTVFYGVEETNNVLLRKKIHKVIDGEDWFKYTAPLRSYYLKEYQILGITQKSLDGLWDINEFFQLETEYYVQVTTPTGGSSYITPLDPDDGVKFFIDKDEALEYIKTLEHEASELDKK